MCGIKPLDRNFNTISIITQNHTTIKHPPLILRSYFPMLEKRYNFWILFIIQYYIMNIGMLIVPCWHAFIVALHVYVIMNLKVLNRELSNVQEVFINKFHNIHLVKCVNDRERIFNFVRELMSLISSSLFLDFIIFSLLLCMLLFQSASQVYLYMSLS